MMDENARGPAPESGLSPVFKALAHPSRRRILDLLRHRSRTTGELVAAFGTSRSAVMKHLGVLRRAGLVNVHRQGRRRFNRLNPIPLQQLQERWVRPYEELWARRLLSLRRRAEGPPRKGVGTMSEVDRSQLGIGSVDLEIAIGAPREQVWKALVEETTEWWLPDFYAGGERTRGFHIEPQVGGRMYEDWGDGAGLLWYTVIGIHPPGHLELAGHLTPDFGGPAKSYMKILLEEDGDGTRVRIADSVFGKMGEGAVEQFRSGWEYLFTQGLKVHVEGGQGG